MKKIVEIRTNRLLLRQWCDKDLAIFAKLNADVDVMTYFPNTLSTSESNIMAHKIKSLIKEKGWGFWAVELLENKTFIGFVGLNEPDYKLPVTSCTEIGWRLAKAYWGHGYASEAANASLEFAFQTLNLDQVYSFTPVSNIKSRAVMERLNMINTNNNFNHPMIPENNPLREHVLYRLDKSRWLENYQLWE